MARWVDPIGVFALLRTQYRSWTGWARWCRASESCQCFAQMSLRPAEKRSQDFSKGQASGMVVLNSSRLRARDTGVFSDKQKRNMVGSEAVRQESEVFKAKVAYDVPVEVAAQVVITGRVRPGSNKSGASQARAQLSPST